MTRWLPGCLILAILAASLSAAQDAPSKKADEPRKSNSVSPFATKKSTAADETTGKPSPSRDDLPMVPAGGKVWLSPEEVKELLESNQKLREQNSLLERQLKKEKIPPSVCKLSGRLDGDVAALRVEFRFATTTPQCTVFLGLKNGFLVDEGQIDDGVPHLESTEVGYFVRVDKESPDHRLSLNVRVPVVVKRSAATAAGNERGFDLGLPGAAVTTLAFELPNSAKDVRWNDKAVTPNSPGHWDETIGAPTNLVVVWNEAVATPSAAIGPSARANLKVKLEDGRIEFAGDLVLEDPKNPTRLWQLLLPAQVKVSPVAGSAAFTWQPPVGKSNLHAIRATEPADKLTLSLQAQYVRTAPQQKFPVGPVLVQGVATQGTILIQSAPGVLRGQQLLYHRFGEFGQIFQRDPPKATAGVDNRALFQFWNPPFSGKNSAAVKASLELEWKTEKGQVDATVEHDVKLRENHGQWLVDIESRFLVHSTNSGVEALDLQTPALSFPDLLWLGVQPALGFPAALRWPVALAPRPAFPLSLAVLDDGGILDVPPADAQRRVRLNLHRPIGTEKMVVKVQSRLLGPGDANRFRIEFPKLVGVLDRGAKVTVWSPPGQELLVGPPNQREPVHDKYEQTSEQMPTILELSWRGSQRERLARTVVDVTVREHMLQVRQTLNLPAAAWSGGALQTGQLALRLPSPGFAFSVLNLNAPRLSQDKTLAWIKLPPESKGIFDIQLEYDVPLTEKKNEDVTFVPLLWPEGATNRDAKLRIWTDPGVTPTLVGLGDQWKERLLEEGPNPGVWPALVAAGLGPTLPVALKLEQSAGHRLPALVADRSLIQVRVEDDGSQTYRCRYLVRKFSATSLDVELPIAWDQGQSHCRIAGKEISGVRVVDPLRGRVHVPLAPHLYPQPVLFEIAFRIPAAQVDGKRFWQTPLATPRFDEGVVFGPTRWQVALPGNQTPLVLGAASVDYHWNLNGWLLSPESSVTGAELDAWIGAAADLGDSNASGLAWWRGTVNPQRIYHIPRQFWLVLCSGAVLVLGMLLLLTPMSRFATGLIVLGVGLAIAVLGLFHDYLLPVLFMGSQPGLAVLAVIAAIQWVMQERYRRQLIFMPSFSRVPQGSTVIRNQSKPPRDPSTIDAPPVGPGSVKSTGH